MCLRGQGNEYVSESLVLQPTSDGFIASSALMAFLSHFSAVHTSEYCRYQVLLRTATLDHCAGKVLKNTMQENKAKNVVFI